MRCLMNLKVLNLSNNCLESLEINCQMPNLVELNLRNNQISKVTLSAENALPDLRKLYLSGNQLDSMDAFTQLPSLTDLSLEGNPIETRDKEMLATAMQEKFPTLVYYNLQRIQPPADMLQSIATKINEKEKMQDKHREKTPKGSSALNATAATNLQICKTKSITAASIEKMPASLIKREMPVKIELPVFKPKNECNVVKIIQKEWDREVERLNNRKAAKAKSQATTNESKFNKNSNFDSFTLY